METSRFTRRTDDFVNTPELARPYYVDVKDGILKPVSPEQPMYNLFLIFRICLLHFGKREEINLTI